MRFRKRQKKKIFKQENLISEIYLQFKKKDASHKVRKSVIKNGGSSNAQHRQEKNQCTETREKKNYQWNKAVSHKVS